MTTSSQDSDWLGLIRGDHRAFERVYRAHAPALLRYGRQFSDGEVVGEALQDLFVRLWERRERLKPDVRVRPYLLVSLRNDLVRANKRAGRQALFDEQHDQPVESVEDELAAGELVDERKTSVHQAIERLSARERELIDLRFRQNLDYEDIVEVTGISYQSARNTLARAIGKLRAQLGVLFWWTLGTSLVSATYFFENLRQVCS